MAGLRLNLPQSPQNTWLVGRYSSRSRMMLLAGGNDASVDRRSSLPYRSTSLLSSTQTQQSHQQTSSWRSRFSSFGRTRNDNGSHANNQAGEQQQQESSASGWRNRFRPSMRPFALFNGRGTNASSDPSPSHMEEGVVR
jgi:hypothetical protein